MFTATPLAKPSLRDQRKNLHLTVNDAAWVIRRSNSYVSHAEREDGFSAFTTHERQLLRAYYRLAEFAPHTIKR